MASSKGRSGVVAANGVGCGVNRGQSGPAVAAHEVTYNDRH